MSENVSGLVDSEVRLGVIDEACMLRSFRQVCAVAE